jgi:hypothetical protein
MVAMTLKRVKMERLVATVMTQPISIITQQEKKGVNRNLLRNRGAVRSGAFGRSTFLILVEVFFTLLLKIA